MDGTMTQRTDLADGDLIVERTGGIAQLIFNRPERMNAMTLASWQALADLTRDLVGDSSLRVVSFEGAGGKAFVSGADITEFESVRADPDTARRYDEAVHTALTGIAQLPVPTVALVEGYCIGGGLEIALSCDLRIASDNAQFAITPAKLGLGFSYDSVALIERVASATTAADLLFSARRVGAGEAKALRLCERVIDAEEFPKASRAAVSAIAGNAPLTIRAIKAALLDLRKPVGDRDRAPVDELVAACIDSDDYREGRAAFAEKRRPRFEGR